MISKIPFLGSFFKKPSNEKTGLLVVGHDLKFMPPVIDHYKSREDYFVDTFSYSGHLVQNREKLLKMLPDYHLVYCEWGLDNINFLSKNKLAGQKLMTRIHLQEFATQFPDQTDWSQVDVVIFACEYQMERFKQRFPKYADKCKMIYVAIDCDAFDQPKEPDAPFTLGIVGILPMRKAPHQALEILGALRRIDQRYRLSVKSRRPEELAWLWSRPEERAYYDRFYTLVESVGLRDAVIFEPHGSDVEHWFRKAGFLLSTSEFEGSHQAVAEGMASGSIPVIRNWDGADTLYPERFIYKNVDDAVRIIRNYADSEQWIQESLASELYARQMFDSRSVLPQFDRLFDTLLGKNVH